MKPPYLFIKMAIVALIALSCWTVACSGIQAQDTKFQEEIAKELIDLAHAGYYELDDDGNVIKFGASNHQIYYEDKSKPPAPGIDDANFRKILKFPKLQAIFLEKQPLNNSSYMLIAQLPEIIDLRLHYANDKQFREKLGDSFADENFALVVNHMQKPLKILELKHLFGIDGTVIDQLKPQPELEKLELDNDFCGPEAVPFILAAPKVRSLQLHRTTINEEDLLKIGQALKGLEVIVIRPNGNPPSGNPIDGGSLRAFEKHPSLKYMYMGIDWHNSLEYDGGLEYLATAPNMKYLHMAPNRPIISIESPQVQALHKAAPNIIILTKDGIIGGTREDMIHQDEDYRWGICK
ncbi:MAG: hypothetical protein ACLFUS_17885 [Candidatus Sumerlaeia bacterium]